MKEFNITGTCIPDRHFMVDISKKIQQIMELVEKGKYFTINRPRQYGKTTTLSNLFHKLKNNSDYLIIRTSFEGLGEDKFKTEENFCSTIFYTLSGGLINESEEYKESFRTYGISLKKLEDVSKAITRFIQEQNRKVVLMIDEVDKASNHNLFLNFLGMLRNKYLDRADGNDQTFHSIVLAGVYDIKNLKLKMRPDSESKYNSPWNIATDFEVDMSFNTKEIAGMLEDYTSTTHIGIDIPLISQEIYNYTKGYPFLVSKICKVVDEKLDKDWSIEGIKHAINITLENENTLFDDLIKNLEIHKDLYELVYTILVDGNRIPFEIYNPLIKLGVTFGILAKQNGATSVSNKIFEVCIYNYMISKTLMKEKVFTRSGYIHQFIQNNKLNMENILNKFQEIMHDEYREKDDKFIEREGRLLFLCFLKPIINGVGFYYVESETREDSRMDVVVTFGNEEHIIELKIWRGKKREDLALEQLSDYLESKRKTEGYLLNFNFNQKKDYKKEWVNFMGKKIYRVDV
ncbi:MAG: AAA family ATPase [Leptospiraceae bacterium]|nr:AAA family ATPase [Leptospiraceae bacterium]MCP5496421.1 AAA family ATPase [Leptospiraceae bacterium]